MFHDDNALCVGLIGCDYGEVLALHAHQTLQEKGRAIRHDYELVTYEQIEEVKNITTE